MSSTSTAKATPASTSAQQLVEEWEKSLPSEDLLRATVADLQSLLAEPRWPEHVGKSASSAGAGPTPAVPSETDERAADGLRSLAQKETRHMQGTVSDLQWSGQPIETSQQFLAWFAQVNESMERGQEEGYRMYLDRVKRYQDRCDEIANQIDGILGHLEGLEQSYESVVQKTGALQFACESLLDEQGHLASVSQGINKRLNYFYEYENLSRMLNAPGENLCLNETFIPSLHQLDECLQFMRYHMHYKDAESYLVKFRQAMTRGLTMIKLHFVNTLRSTATTVVAQVKEKGMTNLSPSAETALFYVKFRTMAPKLKQLGIEIKSRCDDHPEYAGLLNECFENYQATREQIMTTPIEFHLGQLSSGDIISVTRRGLAYIFRVCVDETQLFGHFFSDAQEALFGNNEPLISALYDFARPRIIHENSVPVLAELCGVLMEALRKHPESGGDYQENEALGFKETVQSILEDAQNRLMFRAHQYVVSEIENYAPTPADIDYPNKLVQSSTSSVPLESNDASPMPKEQEDSGDASKPSTDNLLNPIESYKDWFPTLRKTLFLLSKLHKNVKNTIFDDFSQEVIDVCRKSLTSASGLIIAKSSRVDGQLFLIKHLLILREQIAPFDANFVHTQNLLNFTYLRDAALELINSGRSLFSLNMNNAIVGFVQHSVPRMVEHQTVDGRQELDKDLKSICEEYISDVVKSMTNPLSSFCLRVSAFSLRPESKSGQSKLAAQSFAQPEQVLAIYKEFKKNLDERLTEHLDKLHLYLGNPTTEVVLSRPLKANVFDAFQKFFDIIRTEYDPDTVARISSPAELSAHLEL